MELYSHQLYTKQPNACRKMVGLYNKMKAMDPPPRGTSLRFINTSLRCPEDLQGGADVYKKNWPEFFSNDEISIHAVSGGLGSLFNATGAIFVLLAEGKIERANYLLNQGLEFMEPMSIKSQIPYDVLYHALLGDKDSALVAFRETLESGYFWSFHVIQAEGFDSMLDEPEWNELIERFSAEIARQRQWYQDHKDESPF